MAYTSPETALEYLLRSGMTKEKILKMSGISRASLYRFSRDLSKGNRPRLREPVASKALALYTLVREQKEQDEAVRKELGL